MTAALVFAQDKDVDQADSLDFEAFHKDEKTVVKVWKDSDTIKTALLKTYEQTPENAATSTSLVSPSVLQAYPLTIIAPLKGHLTEPEPVRV